jgi:hypothetical protein
VAAKRDKQPKRGESILLVETPKTTTGQPLTLTTVKQEKALAPLHARGREAATRSLLVFELSDLNYTGKFYVRVFVNKGDADSRTSTDDEHFVGFFGALDSHAAHGDRHAKGTTIFRVPLAPSVSNFYKAAPPDKPFTIRLVPVDGSKDLQFTVRRVLLKVY